MLSAFVLCSGACSLVYQVVWQREFRLIFGASTSASGAVLAAFIGGLGAGSLALGGRAERSKNPLAFKHNNAEDTSWTTLATLATMTTGVNTQTASAIREELRYAITAQGSNAWQSVYANILAPAWRPY